MNSPIASPVVQSVFGTNPARLSPPTLGTIFSMEAECSPSPVVCQSFTVSSLLHEASMPAATIAAEITIFLIFLVNFVLL